ncbi:hypothetical protein AB0M46_15440 [Dactylosporangium sp. NPDC051485]|uniref:hypothetical protein n=1 Tax=Dactylosporangium sp. NPDC051485 TaxID=3154846 RepID=UPI0034487C77
MSDEEAPGPDETPAHGPGPAVEPEESPDTENFRQDAQTIINILGGVHADNAVLGTVGAKATRDTGSIRIAAIRADLLKFCPSETYQQAAKVLSEHGMVLLLARPGTGRFTAALSLLNDWPEMSDGIAVTSLTPTVTIRDLAEPGFLKGGGRYLVHDMRGDGRASADQRFELSRLRHGLVGSGARLVITADSAALFRGDFGDLVVAWEPPDSATVFERRLAVERIHLSADDQTAARAYAAALSRPAEVAAFVQRLSSDGLEKAMHSQSNVDRREVAGWFDETSRPLTEKLAVAAACFLSGVPERTFERCLSRLDQLFREYDPDERAPLDAPRDLDNNPWVGSETLLATLDGDGPFKERRVGFRSPYMREHAIGEIWHRYGYRLIQPMRQWITELARDVSSDVRVQNSIGVALLAEGRWADVKESFLVPWADGEWVYRTAAANLLSVMAASERLAPQALELALGWSQNQGSRRAMTAALALGSRLSLRYPEATFEELWYLASRSKQIAAVARIALSVMLAGAGGDAERAVWMLRTTVAALDWSTENATALGRRGSLTAVLSILEAPSLTSDELVIGRLLQAEPGAARPIGMLFAEVLASGPHRHAGVNLLRRLLMQLADGDDPLAVADELGLAVKGRWTHEQRAVLAPQVERALAMSEEDTESTRKIIRSFIQILDRR